MPGSLQSRRELCEIHDFNDPRDRRSLPGIPSIGTLALGLPSERLIRAVAQTLPTTCQHTIKMALMNKF